MITPTSARTLVVPSDINLQNTLQLAFPNAQPTDNLDYWLDVHNVTNYTDSVTSFSVAPVPGLTITPVVLSSIQPSLIVGFYISGGTLYTTYPITVTVHFASGSTYVATCYLSIGSLISEPPSQSVNITSSTLQVTGDDIELPSIVAAGTYTSISSLTIDAYGRVTSITTGTVTPPAVFFFELEDGSGQILLENGSGFLELEAGP